MTDYTKATGNSGTMMIRDIPGENRVEFWLNANNSTTWNAALPWGWTINGSTGNSTFNYQPGVGWKRLANYSVTTSQTVTFRLGSSGTSGFGGPTTFNQFISRQTTPPAPSPVTFTNVTSTSLTAQFTSNGDGGYPIIEWLLGYGTDPGGAPLPYLSTTGVSNIIGLTPGATYYFWAIGRNALGYGAWSPRTQVTMLRVPGGNGSPGIREAGQVSAYVMLNAGDSGGDPITLYQFGWSLTDLAIPTNVVSFTPDNTGLPDLVTGLPPGTTLYFRSRTRNSVGWSPWSASTVTRTVAGARIKVGAVWKEAIPYVKVAGVWRLARPWVRVAGTWRISK